MIAFLPLRYTILKKKWPIGVISTGVTTEAVQIFPALTRGRGAGDAVAGTGTLRGTVEMRKREDPHPLSEQEKLRTAHTWPGGSGFAAVGSQNLPPVHTYLTIPVGLIKRRLHFGSYAFGKVE